MFNQTLSRLLDYRGRPCLKRDAGLKNALYGRVLGHETFVVQLGREILFKAEEDLEVLCIFELNSPLPPAVIIFILILLALSLPLHILFVSHEVEVAQKST